ncbi:MAG: HpcH/HpaI aldolase/citrate lyase family protein [Acidimicrobiales bacterium]
MRVRSVLFGPASRVDFVEKFVRAGADVGVLDLEDATPEGAKSAARDAIADARPGAADLGSTRLWVRVNSVDTAHFTDDLAAAVAAAAHGIVVPKIERIDDVVMVRAAMEAQGLGDAALCAGIESVAGVDAASDVCVAGPDVVYFGAEDFITDLGGIRTEHNTEVLYARSRVAIAARMGSLPALDQVVVDYGDDERFRREALEARTFGYAGKLCVHPAQVAIANDAFTPTAAEIEHARGVVTAADAAAEVGTGVVAYEGTMVDAPIIDRARNLLASLD